MTLGQSIAGRTGMAALALVALCAQAQEMRPSFALRGFGTLGAAHSSEKNADFVHGFFEPNGAGFTHDWALGVDSKVGVQADAALTERLSAVVQLVSLHGYDNTYRPKVEWANLKYQFNPDFEVRVGRTVASPFMVSESRLVGFANIWVRPPQEVYGLIPITNKDGIDASHKSYWGGVTNTLQASFGGTALDLPGSGTVDAKRYIGISDTIERGGFTARVGFLTGQVDLHTPGLDALVVGYAGLGAALGGIGAAAAQARAISERVRFEDKKISAFTAGIAYDQDRWLMMAEWANFKGASFLADSKAWYVTAGYRFGAFTPYATLARLSANQPNEPGVSPAGLPPALAATAVALNAGLAAGANAGAFAQRSVSAGLRWDVARNVAAKLQYDRINLDSWSSGRLANVQPNFRPGGTVNVFSIAVDFVF
jgi:hypothetical protein